MVGQVEVVGLIRVGRSLSMRGGSNSTPSGEGPPMSKAWILVLIVLTGCSAKHPLGPNLELPVSCVRRVRMENCNLRTDPPVCKRVMVKFDKGCGVVEVVK